MIKISFLGVETLLVIVNAIGPDLDDADLAGAGSPNVTYTRWDPRFEGARLSFLRYDTFSDVKAV